MLHLSHCVVGDLVSFQFVSIEICTDLHAMCLLDVHGILPLASGRVCRSFLVANIWPSNFSVATNPSVCSSRPANRCISYSDVEYACPLTGCAKWYTQLRSWVICVWYRTCGSRVWSSLFVAIVVRSGNWGNTSIVCRCRLLLCGCRLSFVVCFSRAGRSSPRLC